MKRIVYILLLACVLVVSGCAGSSKQKATTPAPSKTPAVTKVTVLNPIGPLVFPVAGLAGNKVKTDDLKIDLQYWKTGDEAIGLLSANKAEFAVLPVVTGANINASGMKLTLLGVHEWKVFYLIAAPGNKFDSWQDLKGKQVYIPVGKGSTIDLLLNAGLQNSGLKPNVDTKIVAAEPQEIVALFKSGKVQYAALPEPFVTLATQGGKGQIVLDFQKYWAELSGGPERMPVAGLFVKTDFMKKHPAETAKVATSLKNSIEWSKANTDQALAISAKTLPIPAPVMKTALTRLEIYWVDSKTCKSEVKTFLSQMQKLYPEGLKKLPGEEFYAK
ncbi:MAG: ABC transporter substrate-binding protein [Deltaproteobacteria bacterium]